MCYKIFISLRKRNIPVRARRHRLLAMRLALTRLRSLREALPRMFPFPHLLGFIPSYFHIFTYRRNERDYDDEDDERCDI